MSKTFLVLIASGRHHSIGRYGILIFAEAKHLLAENTLGKVRPPRV